MMRLLKNKKAQQTAEYAILMAFVIAAAMAIQTYVKRGLQAKVRDSVIKCTADTSFLGGTSQYEPYYLKSDFTSTSDMTKTEWEKEAGAWDRDFAADATHRTGTQEYTSAQDGG